MQRLRIVDPAYHKMLAIFFRQFLYDTAYDYRWMLYHSVVTPCSMYFHMYIFWRISLKLSTALQAKKKNTTFCRVWGIVFTSLKTNRWKLAWLWATNVSSHNFRQKRCYTMMTFWRTTESFYMACWIPISLIYNFSFRKYIANCRWKQVENLTCVLQ